MSNLRGPIVVVGSINMDLVTTAPAVPLAGQTLTGTDFTTTPGGKGANQAVAAARLGHPVHMIGMVGKDVFGQALLDNLDANGVDTAAVARVDGPSGVATICVAAKGENSIVVVPGANGKVTPEFIDRQSELIRNAGIILCQLELPLQTVQHTLELCANANTVVILDPAPAAGLPDSALKHVGWLTPNQTEEAFYLGANFANSPPQTSAQLLLRRGAKGVILKRGSEGAYLASTGQSGSFVPAFQVNAVDTVAAGDCFNGAFAVALLEGQPPLEAARFASAAAAISVTRRGAQASMPARAEVDAFLAEQE